jgi:thiol-disulfide isomerase/thioredoxin
MKISNKIFTLSSIILTFLMVSCYSSEDVPEETIVDPSEFTQKLLLEDYTGTWCPNCPRAARAIEAAVADNNRFIPVGIHFYTNANPEEMQNEYSAAIVNEYHPEGGFPIVELNRQETVWAGDYLVTTLESMLNRYAPVGLAIDSSLAGNLIDVSVKVGFVEETTTVDNYKLVVFLLESGMIYPQQDGGEEVEDYEHENVLRYAFTSVFGDAVPNQVADNHRYSKDFAAVALPASIENTNNLKLVAFVLDKNNNCLNVQVANVGENKDFD